MGPNSTYVPTLFWVNDNDNVTMSMTMTMTNIFNKTDNDVNNTNVKINDMLLFRIFSNFSR